MKWSKLAKFLEYKKNKSVFSLISFQAIMYFLNVDLPLMVNFEAFSVLVRFYAILLFVIVFVVLIIKLWYIPI